MSQKCLGLYLEKDFASELVKVHQEHSKYTQTLGAGEGCRYQHAVYAYWRLLCVARLKQLKNYLSV